MAVFVGNEDEEAHVALNEATQRSDFLRRIGTISETPASNDGCTRSLAKKAFGAEFYKKAFGARLFAELAAVKSKIPPKTAACTQSSSAPRAARRA
jgi:hypothetical protein